MSDSNREAMGVLRGLHDALREWSFAVRVAEGLKLPEDLDQAVAAALEDRGAEAVRAAVERLASLGVFTRAADSHNGVVEAMRRLSEFADLDESAKRGRCERDPEFRFLRRREDGAGRE